MKIQSFLLAGVLLVGGALLHSARSADEKTEKPMNIYSFKMPSLTGKDVDLSQYKGKVVLVVNTASKCGYTKQYKGLEALHEAKSEEGLAILGFPANNFGGQEPGSNEEIGAFCEKNYGVKFDMFSKISVKGEDKAPLYQYLTENAPEKGEVSWNFEKFLIGRNGEIVGRYKSKVAPDSPELLAAIDAELAKK